MPPTLTDEQIAHSTLRKYIPLGPPLIIVFRGRSASGMARWYDVYGIPTCYIGRDQHPLSRLTWSVARLTGIAYDKKREALKIKGCGFCAEDDIVEAIAIALGFERKDVTYQSV
jgi:hypothetical protein